MRYKDTTFNSKIKITKFKICEKETQTSLKPPYQLKSFFEKVFQTNVCYVNTPHDIAKRRTRGLQTPHAEIANAARGDYERRTRRFTIPQVKFHN